MIRRCLGLPRDETCTECSACLQLQSPLLQTGTGSIGDNNILPFFAPSWPLFWQLFAFLCTIVSSFYPSSFFSASCVTTKLPCHPPSSNHNIFFLSLIFILVLLDRIVIDSFPVLFLRVFCTGGINPADPYNPMDNKDHAGMVFLRWYFSNDFRT